MRASKEQAYLTISELAELLNRSLEEKFPEVFFQGEISQLTKASSGHMYFTVKDERSQLSAVMWRGLVSQLAFKPEPGLAVLCMGRPNVYHASGRLQLVVFEMHPAGEGALQRKFLQLKEKLEKEGLFSASRKRSLPFLPKAVGVVTSSQGAVIHDIMVKLHERLPSLKVFLVDVRVQGEGAASEIAAGIKLLNESGLVDVIIVGRGGGSLEDLWAFNEEAVVRAIFASAVPVVSGVGHEVDVTLSDFVADVRAPTPTAAAEMVVPKRSDLLNLIEQYERRLADYGRWFLPLEQRADDLALRLERAAGAAFEKRKVMLSALEVRMRALKPEKISEMFRSRIDILGKRFYAAGSTQLSQVRTRIDVSQTALAGALGSERFKNLLTKVSVLADRLSRSRDRSLHDSRAKLQSAAARLEALNPRKVLARGYSVVFKGKDVVTSGQQVAVADELDVMLMDGRLAVGVQSVNLGEGEMTAVRHGGTSKV